MATQVRTIRVINKVEGANEIRKLSKQYGQLNKGVKSTADTLGLFKRAFQFAIAGVGIRELARASDQFQLLRDRIKVFTGSQREADQAFSSLVRGARFTRTSVASLAESFNRVALATQELGLNSKQIIGLTVGLQQSFRLAGSTIAEATGATIQLTQGLASGQLRGQELRSVLEANAVIGRILANELGVTRGQLIKFAESGKITSEVVLQGLINNIDKLNSQAQNLGTTFEQGLTIILDAFRVQILEINQELGLSKAFSNFAETVADNADIILKAVASLAIGIAVTYIPTMIRAFDALRLAIAKNPFGLLLVGASTAIAFLAFNWEKSVLQMQKVWLNFRLAIIEGGRKLFLTLKPIEDFIRRIQGLKPRDNKLFTKNEDQAIANIKKSLEGVNKQLKDLEKPKGIENFGKDLKSINLDGKRTLQTLAGLNLALRNQEITLRQYDNAIAELKQEDLNKRFEEGKINIDQYNKGLLQVSAGLVEISSVSLGAQAGLRQVGQTASNVALQVQKSFVTTFKILEDAIFDFIKKGQFQFSKFAESIIDELTRIVIRAQIIAPIAQGIGQLLTTGAGGGVPTGGGAGVAQTPSAGIFGNGGAFVNGRVTAFASGGIVGSPTIFPMANGMGLMGEAGPEAIMPLTRINGKLGVRSEGGGTQVNIINNVGGEVETSERQGPNGERILDVMINQKVRESLSNGSLDKSLSENFGLRRVGR